MNPNFLVDFGAEPDGPVLAHEVRHTRTQANKQTNTRMHLARKHVPTRCARQDVSGIFPCVQIIGEYV